MENNKTQNLNQGESKIDAPSEAHVKAHTLTEDILHTIEGGNLGAVKEIIDAEEQKEMEKSGFSSKTNKNTIYIGLGTVLLLAGVFIAYYFTAGMMKDPSFFSSDQNTKDVLHPDFVASVNIGNLYKSDASKAIYEASQKISIKKGQLGRILVVEGNTPIGLSGLMTALDGNFSLTKESGINENFVFGSILDKEKHAFLMFNISNINQAFPKIQSWESKMFLDMYGLFGIELGPEEKYLFDQPFQDMIVANKNARAILDNDGNLVFMYVFINENSLIFSDSVLTVEKVLERIRNFDLQK